VGSVVLLTVKVPPYCGVPSLSHQFPVPVVVAVTVVAVDVVEVVVDVIAAVVVVVVVSAGGVVAAVVAVVDELQDAKTTEATSRNVTNPQMTPFFINVSFLIMNIEKME
jgi:hypothetical protein